MVKTYLIQPKAIRPDVRLSTTSFDYSGASRKPSVSVRDGSRVIPAVDYHVTYPLGRKNPGRYIVEVKMRGDYRGVASAGFVIRPAGVRIRSVSVSGSHLTVRWKARKRQTDGYQIRCTEKKASRRRHC